MYIINKKGLSDTVQIVMISALSILAIMTVAKYVISLSDELDSQLSPAVDCLTMKSKVISACLNNQNQIELDVNLFDTEDPTLKIVTGEEVFSCNTQTCSTCQLSE